MRALVHAVSPQLDRCELTFAARVPIDVAAARRQHADYVAMLEDLGVEVTAVDCSPECPDAVFVEDAAIALDGLIVACSLGAASRRREVDNLLPWLLRFGPVARVRPPATLEGGDVLAMGRTLFVGRSARTNDAGIAALRALAAPRGYDVVAVDVRSCLHLETAVTVVADSLLLANPRWIDVRAFAGHTVLAVPDTEPGGANALRVGDSVCVPASQPRTAAMLAAHGLRVRTLDIGEFEKAEAGLTCLSLRFPA